MYRAHKRRPRLNSLTDGFFSCEAHPECVNVKAASKAHVCYPAHMFPQCSTHARGRWGEGLVDKLTQASRGFLISGPGQVGIGCWTAYATAANYREPNPHFISHICSAAQK